MERCGVPFRWRYWKTRRETSMGYSFRGDLEAAFTHVVRFDFVLRVK